MMINIYCFEITSVPVSRKKVREMIPYMVHTVSSSLALLHSSGLYLIPWV